MHLLPFKTYFPFAFVFLLCSFLFLLLFAFVAYGFKLHLSSLLFGFSESVAYILFVITLIFKHVNPLLYLLALNWESNKLEHIPKKKNLHFLPPFPNILWFLCPILHLTIYSLAIYCSYNCLHKFGFFPLFLCTGVIYNPFICLLFILWFSFPCIFLLLFYVKKTFQHVFYDRFSISKLF